MVITWDFYSELKGRHVAAKIFCRFYTLFFKLRKIMFLRDFIFLPLNTLVLSLLLCGIQFTQDHRYTKVPVLKLHLRLESYTWGQYKVWPSNSGITITMDRNYGLMRWIFVSWTNVNWTPRGRIYCPDKCTVDCIPTSYFFWISAGFITPSTYSSEINYSHFIFKMCTLHNLLFTILSEVMSLFAYWAGYQRAWWDRQLGVVFYIGQARSWSL
jgi:hypothetical protein